MKKLVLGILAHVDAGKTTLSEAMLYIAGVIRKAGRVDHKNAFLDTDEQEKARGITIFSKQAELDYKDTNIMLLDTPGHVDFSAETERTLRVLDYAVLLISGKDGIQGHTVTLWKLLKSYNIPAFIFINKMDMAGTDKAKILDELKTSFDDGCIDFTDNTPDYEEVAMCDENLLDEYLQEGILSDDGIREGIKGRRIFPCYFGSALKFRGTESLMDGLDRFTYGGEYGDEFAARVYKITHDEQGNRLTHLKITGGKLKVKDAVESGTTSDEIIEKEKINQIRIYSGEKFRMENEVSAGTVCAVTGLNNTYAGQCLGTENGENKTLLEPALVYNLILPESCDVHSTLMKLKQLEEEDPQLYIIWNEQLEEIQVCLMGEVQLEILKNIILKRFDIDVEFGSGQIVYKETITRPAIGGGHFEPLRHYAEVSLLLEPGPIGSGMVFETDCSEDLLDRNWQRLIMTHLQEKQHIGVLTGSPITDMKITIMAGRAHEKHTEGGDFRQATYRAIRQGLRKTESILLEPWYEFHLEVPSDMIGRAMSDIQKMGGNFESPQTRGEMAVLEGKAPVSEMKDYVLEVTSYTKGYGNIACTPCGHEPCHDQEKVIESIGYDVDRDVENTADSVFCAHGVGVHVPWYEVDDRLHVSVSWKDDMSADEDSKEYDSVGAEPLHKKQYKSRREEEAELQRIFEMTYGKPKERRIIAPRVLEPEREPVKTKPAEVLPEYLLVDGYNIIFAWDELKALAKVNLDSAREALLDILDNYQGYRKCKVIVVFDAYKVKGGERRYEKHGEVDVVFTKEAETADTYIERTTYELRGEYLIRVATSDNLEQMIILGNGAFKISAKEFKAEVERTNEEIAAILSEYSRKNKLNYKNTIELELT